MIKNNGHEMDGLVIMEKGRDIAPTIYLDSFMKCILREKILKILSDRLRLYTGKTGIISHLM